MTVSQHDCSPLDSGSEEAGSATKVEPKEAEPEAESTEWPISDRCGVAVFGRMYAAAL